MREYCERQIEVGFDRDSKKIFDEIEVESARLLRDGWVIENCVADDTLGYINLIFYREVCND